MAPERQFLDWDRPALPAVVDWLVEHFAGPGVLDLAELTVVLPGSRAGRRLLELLLDRVRDDGLRLVPPTITTVGNLPERLYVSRQPFADDLTQRLAWVRAFKQADPDRLGHVLRDRPDDDDEPGWIELADLLGRQHRELAADGLDFDDVVRSELLEPLPRERSRWDALHSIQREYLEVLAREGLWDRQTARLVAIDQGECRPPGAILLVGTVDINRTLRLMLEAPLVVDHVTALVHSSSSHADRFDDMGCLVPEAWQRPPLPVPDAVVRIADRPDDQAAAVAAWLAARESPPRADDVTIGVADESLVPTIRRQLADSGVASRWVHECDIADTEPWTLLEAIAACLETWQAGNDDEPPTIGYEQLAAILRHPAVDRWLVGQSSDGNTASDWIVELDAYRINHLPSRVGQWRGQPDRYSQLRAAFDRLVVLLEPLAAPARPLADWSAPLLSVFTELYAGMRAGREDREGHVLTSSARHIHAAIDRLPETPAALAPQLTCSRTIELALESAADKTIAALPGVDAIELVGWLELALDDAPVMAVCGMNEGHVPQSATSDLFLPDRLRHDLGIMHNARRIARDAYALSVLVGSRDELLLVGGRRTETGDPLLPSRLLLAPGPTGQAARVLQVLDSPPPDRAAVLPGAFAEGPDDSRFLVPPPVSLPGPLESVSVTAFRDWLACHYRFYLKHVLRLKAVDEGPDELSPLTFGNLAHKTLSAFGDSDVSDSDDLDTVRQFLRDEVWRQVGRLHGSHRPEAVVLQVHQLTDRLDAFAGWQVDTVAAGWRIKHTERSIEAGEVLVDTPAGSLSVIGRIDRIDEHRDGGRWRVIDYKTGSKPTSPEQEHRTGKGKWKNLQLPLYRRLVRSALGFEGDIELGFIVLPSTVADTGLQPAEWNDQVLADADQVIEQAVEGMLRGDFWQVTEPPPEFSKDFAEICQQGLPDPPRRDHWKPPPETGTEDAS